VEEVLTKCERLIQSDGERGWCFTPFIAPIEVEQTRLPFFRLETTDTTTLAEVVEAVSGPDRNKAGTVGRDGREGVIVEVERESVLCDGWKVDSRRREGSVARSSSGTSSFGLIVANTGARSPAAARLVSVVRSC
jgi:hypothetical protein